MDVAGAFVARMGLRHCGMQRKGLVAFGTRCRDLCCSISTVCDTGRAFGCPLGGLCSFLVGGGDRRVVG